MRDDIKKILNQLIDLYTNKLNLLQQFINKNNACLSYICSNNLEQLEEAILEDNEIISQIDLVDYEISQEKNNLCKTSGIQEQEFEEHFIKNPHNTIESNLQLIINQIGAVLNEIHAGREEIIKQLGFQMDDLKNDIVTLNQVRKTRDQFPTIH